MRNVFHIVAFRWMDAQPPDRISAEHVFTAIMADVRRLDGFNPDDAQALAEVKAERNEIVAFLLTLRRNYPVI